MTKKTVRRRRPSFLVESNCFRLVQFREVNRLGRACGLRIEEVADGEWRLHAKDAARKMKGDELRLKLMVFFQALATVVESVAVVSITDRRADAGQTGIEWFVLQGGRAYCVNGDQISSWLQVLARETNKGNPFPDILTEVGELYPIGCLEKTR